MNLSDNLSADNVYNCVLQVKKQLVKKNNKNKKTDFELFFVFVQAHTDVIKTASHHAVLTQLINQCTY